MAFSHGSRYKGGVMARVNLPFSFVYPPQNCTSHALNLYLKERLVSSSFMCALSGSFSLSFPFHKYHISPLAGGAFSATRARWHFHMVVVGNWARVTVGVTPPRVLVLVTPPRVVEEVDQAEPRAIGKKRRFGKYGLARKAW